MLTIATGRELVGGQHAGDLRGAEVDPSPHFQPRCIELSRPIIGCAQADSQTLWRSVQDICQLGQTQQGAVLAQQGFFDGRHKFPVGLIDKRRLALDYMHFSMFVGHIG